MTHPTISRWHQVVESRDLKALHELLDENAVFHSPVVHLPQVGRELVHQYLSAAFGVLFTDSFHYVREVVGGRDAVLEFVVEIDGITIKDALH